MICVPYRIRSSKIKGAGKGLFIAKEVTAGTVLVAPDKIENTLTTDLLDTPDYAHQAHSSIRWFENVCTVSPGWPDECFVNHSFHPNGLWHLGFIFALTDLTRGTEITVDYRLLLAPGYKMEFKDTATGRDIIGMDWHQALLHSSQALARICQQPLQTMTTVA